MKQTLLLLAAVLLLTACHSDYTPKPVAYLRFDMPPHEYADFDTNALPFAFQQPRNADVIIKKNTPKETYIDIVYPDWRAYLFLTYKPIHSLDDLSAQVDTSYAFMKQHFDYSTGLDEQRYINPEGRVYATTYRLKGTSVASTYQFWATDSTRHFLRGALFIDCTPNNDSLSPILSYLHEDVEHLIETLHW